jgi:hypothetical protein
MGEECFSLENSIYRYILLLKIQERVHVAEEVQIYSLSKLIVTLKAE